MPTTYMLFWSLLFIMAIGLWRLRDIGRLLIVLLVTGIIVLLSQTLFVHLSISAGINPHAGVFIPGEYLAYGPLAWLALLVMPCGWLGPAAGLHLLQRWSGAQANAQSQSMALSR